MDRKLSDVRLNEMEIALRGERSNVKADVDDMTKLVHRPGYDRMTMTKAVHKLSEELLESDKIREAVIEDLERVRRKDWAKQRNLMRVRVILQALLTNEGQQIQRNIHGLKAKDTKGLEAANRKTLQDLLKYVIDRI